MSEPWRYPRSSAEVRAVAEQLSVAVVALRRASDMMPGPCLGSLVADVHHALVWIRGTAEALEACEYAGVSTDWRRERG